MCASLAVSREHVPPKSLFPERKDFPGVDFRQQLITVPSCEVHNMAKSHDDEFLMVCLAGVVGNNSIGYQHNLGKVSRAVRRSASRLLQKVIIKQQRVFRVELGDNEFADVIWGTPDIARLQTCFDRVARGLYFQDFARRFDGDVHVHLGFLHHEKGNAKTMGEFLRERLELDMKDMPKLGSNPEVFTYQRSQADPYGLFAYRLRFYGSLEVQIGMWPSGTTASRENLVQLSINGGMKTVISLDGTSFEFN